MLPICLAEIRRCRPYFIGLLGERYGWVPEPRHFRDAADRQRQQLEPRSITDLEVRHAVLDQRRKLGQVDRDGFRLLHAREARVALAVDFGDVQLASAQYRLKVTHPRPVHRVYRHHQARLSQLLYVH